MQPGNHIEGKVSDAAGQPAANIEVALLRPSSWTKWLSTAMFVSTDASGRYNIREDRTWRLLGGHLSSRPNNNEPHPRLFYPGVSTPDGAQLLHVASLLPCRM